MAVYAKVGGKYVGLEPGTVQVYQNRASGGWWEELRVTKRGQWYDVDFVAANKPLRLRESDRTLETGSHHDGWGGQWAVVGNTLVCDGVVLELEGFAAAKTVHLEQRGNDFVDANGQRIVLAGVDAFCAYRQYLDGGEAALEPFIRESNTLGFQVWRVFMQGSVKQNGVLQLTPRDPGYYDKLRPFADYLNRNGLILLATVFVDNQDVLSDLGHWSRVADALRGSQSLLSGFNQWSKNKSNFDPWALGDPGMIWSRGSDVDDTITAPKGASASELHATRNSFDRALMDSTASPPFMRSMGAGMVWMTEGNPFGDSNGYTESQAWKLGRGYSIEWALAVFHNRQSQRGLLMSEATAKAGAAWVKGLQI